MPNNCSGSWNTNTGASEHMTFDFTFLTNVTLPINLVHVILPDVSLKPVTKIVQSLLLPNLTLKNVLYVPKFKYNFLLVSKLVDDQPF